MFCGETIPVLLNGVTACEPVEVTLTFWNCPPVITAGTTVTEAVPPEPIAVVD
jgi:hypothetical protein